MKGADSGRGPGGRGTAFFVYSSGERFLFPSSRVSPVGPSAASGETRKPRGPPPMPKAPSQTRARVAARPPGGGFARVRRRGGGRESPASCRPAGSSVSSPSPMLATTRGIGESVFSRAVGQGIRARPISTTQRRPETVSGALTDVARHHTPEARSAALLRELSGIPVRGRFPTPPGIFSSPGAAPCST